MGVIDSKYEAWKNKLLDLGKEFNQKYGEPLARYEYAGLSSAAMKKKRIRQTCYHCLCSYQNQNKYELLDRAQAVILLEKLLPKGQK